MILDPTLKDLLTKADLYGLLARKYEYADPQKHMYYDLKHFHYVMKVEQHYMMLEGRSCAPKMMAKRCKCGPHCNCGPQCNCAPPLMPGQFPLY